MLCVFVEVFQPFIMFQHHLGQMQLHSAPWQRCANVSDGSPEVEMIEPTDLCNAKTQKRLCHAFLSVELFQWTLKNRSSPRASAESVWIVCPVWSFLVRWQIIQWCIELGGWVLQWFEVYQCFFASVVFIVQLRCCASSSSSDWQIDLQLEKNGQPRTVLWQDCPHNPTYPTKKKGLPWDESGISCISYFNKILWVAIISGARLLRAR